MNIISLKIAELFKKAGMQMSDEGQNFSEAAHYRIESLFNAIKAGKYFFEIKKLMLSAPNKKEIVTDLGTYAGWKDFLVKQQLNYSTIEQYIFMYKHQQEFEEMKLLSKESEDIKSGASGHRKIAACDAVKWYLKLLEKDPSVRGKVTAADYQAHKSQLAAIGANAVDSINLKLTDYFSIMSELTKLREENQKLRARVAIEQV